MKRSGHRFEIFREGGLWYWQLQGAYFPSGPIAKSGRGYTTRQAAVRSIESAKWAAARAPSEPILREAPIIPSGLLR